MSYRKRGEYMETDLLDQQTRYMEAIQDFCLMDDTFMQVVFADKDCVQLLVDTIFQKHIEIAFFQSQYNLKNLHGRSLIVDILVQTTDGKRINIEVQRNKDGAHPRRAAFHESLIDADVSRPKDKWQEMSDVTVVFICDCDVLGCGEAIYHIHSRCNETGQYVEDGMEKIYVNGKRQDDTDLGRLMHDFYCTKAEDMYYEVLREEIRYFKEEKGGQQAMCEIMDRLIKENEEKARLEGEALGRLEGERIGEVKGKLDLIKTYAIAKDLTFVEAMMDLHVSKQDQSLIMRYL